MELALIAAITAKKPIATIAKVLLKSVDDFELINDISLLSAAATKIAVIRGHCDPILTLTGIGQICQARSELAARKLRDSKNGNSSDVVEEIQRLEALSCRLENFACNLLNCFQPVLSSRGKAAVCQVLSRDAVDMALKNGWDNRLPFRPQLCPCAYYMSRALGYVSFVAMVITLVVSGGATTSSLTALESIVFVYVIGLLSEKVHEVIVFTARQVWCSWKMYGDIVMLMSTLEGNLSVRGSPIMPLV
ncbi:uncharacterized protein LOC134182904 [Corticium candelabrum]|uniref:uncharacterized protein LOC134182904 n=1 Tax=Corticium candelabrum TaxID=121492 RepID=UPI002E26B804|nr:uncharacterized protein LOC134182904 [Corticium candelabrum]